MNVDPLLFWTIYYLVQTSQEDTIHYPPFSNRDKKYSDFGLMSLYLLDGMFMLKLAQ